MTTVQSALKLSDAMTGPLQGIVRSMNLVISTMHQMQLALDQNEDISRGLSAAKSELVSTESSMAAAIEETIKAQERLNEEISRQQNPPPPPPPPTWTSMQTTEIFQSSGIERYSQEIDALKAKMSNLVATQEALDMSNASFMPAGAAGDIDALQQRLQGLGALLQKVEIQTEALGDSVDPAAFDALNSSAEKIRATIQQAIDEQEAFNTAMKAGDLSGVQKAYSNLHRIIDNTEIEIRNNTKEQERFNRMVEDGEVASDGLFKKIASFVGVYAGIKAVKGFFGTANAAARSQISVEQRLQTIMGNINGMTQDGIELVKQRARELADTPIAISATVGMAGQSQLAEYVYDPTNIAGMTEAMYNLATETYGAEVSAEQLQQTANLLGKVMMGDINALSRNGFKIDAIFTEAEQQLLKTGTEAERAAMVIEMIDENLAGLAEAMGSTPEGQAIKLANAWGTVQEKIGYGLMPLMSQFTTLLMTNMPMIETMFLTTFGTIINLLSTFINVGVTGATFLIENWSFIAPIFWGLTFALGAAVIAVGALNAVMAVKNLLLAISAIRSAAAAAAAAGQAKATFAATVAQYGLNAAMLASPITWIILAVIALIALFFIVVAAINKFAGTSYSATGMIAGAFATVGAVIANVFMGLLQLVFGVLEYWYNWFAAIANFLGNVFNDPIGAVIKLFGDLADNVLGVLQRIASAMDFIFGTKMADTVQGWRSDLEELTKKAMDEYGNGTYEEHFGKLDIDNILDDLGLSMERFDYGDAYQAGYDWGEGIGSGLDLDQFKMPELPGAGGLPTGMWDVGDGTLINGGKLDEVGKIKDTVDISSEDLKTMRELAEMKNVQNFVTLTPQLTFGDTNIQQDGRSVDEIVANIAERMEQELAVSARGVFNV